MSYGQPGQPPPGYYGAAPGPQQPGPGYGQPGPYYYPPEDVDQGKLLAILGYLISPLWIIPLVQRDNAFALFHAKQAMVYTIFMTILGLVIGVVSAITCGFGGILGLGIFPFLYPWIMGIVYASQGEYRPMPWIGHYADQYFATLVADKRPGQRLG